MMKKILIMIIITLSAAAVLSAKADRFEKKRVAVVPSQEIPRLDALLEAALGTDKRFEFVDRKQIPAIIKEWEKRQAGLTGDDDTGELYLSNVDYLITISNAFLSSDFIMDKKGSYYESNLSAQIKVTWVQEGGKTDVQTIKSSANDVDRFRAEKAATEGISGDIVVALKKLFPIEAELYESDMTTVKLMRGSNTGIEKGQRYMLQEKKVINVGKKKITTSKDVAFVKINKVSEEDSSGYIVFGTSDFNLEKTIAKEKYYSNISVELFAGAADYRMWEYPGVDHDFGTYDVIYGFRALYGDDFQIGWGLNADFPGAGRFNRFSLSEITLRYNIHIFRRMFLMVEGGGSLEFSMTNEYIRTTRRFNITDEYEDGHYRLDIEEPFFAWNIAGFVGGGFKFITTENTYLFATASYYFAGDASDWFWLDPASDEEEESGDYDYEMKAIYDARLKDVDKYISKDGRIQDFSPGGFRMSFGVGFYF